MCQFQTLYYHTTIGYSIRCNECKKVQVAWGNLVMTFRNNDFAIFRRLLEKVNTQQQEQENPLARNILIPASCPDMQLLLSRQELGELTELVESAHTELQSLQLLSLFKE